MAVANAVVHNYVPGWEMLRAFVPDHPVDRLMLVAPTPADPTLELSFRFVPADEAQEAELPRGAYWRLRNGGVEAMLVTDGPIERARLEVLAEFDPGALPVVAFDWFDQWWPTAEAFPAPAFALKDEVVFVPRGTTVVVSGRQPAVSAWTYTVSDQGVPRIVSEDSLKPVRRGTEPSAWVSEPPLSIGDFGALITHAKLTNGLTDTLFSYGASKTTFRAYQFKPVLRFLESSAERILIADEVGLGKTISAGLLWTELAARGQADRVLVLCPSNLVEKWIREMGDRFNLDLDLLSSEKLKGLVADLAAGKAPARFQFVSSLEHLRASDAVPRLHDLQFTLDLAIVDEAHQMRNPESRSFQLGQSLSEWTSALILLSATPINLGQRDLLSLSRLLLPSDVQTQEDLDQRLDHQPYLNRIVASLLNPTVSNADRRAWLDRVAHSRMGSAIRQREAFRTLRRELERPALDPDRTPDVRFACAQLSGLSAVLTRTRKAEVQEERPLRDVVSIPVTWSDAERDLYERFLGWARAVCLSNGKPLGFAMQMPLRQAGSCLPATAKRILERAGLADTDEDESSFERRSSILDEEIPPFDVVEAARRVLRVDSKLDALLPQLNRAKEQGKRAILFTFSRRTLDYLERRLQDSFRLATLHGGIPPRDRGVIMDRFRNGQSDLLLATRVASEGLDFEFCSIVVNYDLPWNPMEVEQRIGRIDRIGQTERKIQIWNFHTPETIETQIVTRLMERIGVFEDTIGELEPIIVERFKKTIEELLDFQLSADERAVELRRREAAIRQAVDDSRRLQEQSSKLQAGEHFGIEEIESRIQRGKYVGALELARYVGSWLRQRGARAIVTPDGQHLTVMLSPDALSAVVEWRRSGNHVGTEVQAVECAGRANTPIDLVLDQELARTSGGTLLNVNHPLVQAGVHVGVRADGRFASLRIDSPTTPSGAYLVLLATARWHGLRSTSEIWTEAIRLDDHTACGESVGAVLLAGLATQTWAHADVPTSDLAGAANRAFRGLQERRTAVEQARRRENDALIEERRLRADMVLENKRRDIRGRIAASEGKMIHAFEGQIRAAEARHAAQIQMIEDSRACGLDLTAMAACLVEVTNGAA